SEERGHDDTDAHGHDEVEGHGDEGGDDEAGASDFVDRRIARIVGTRTILTAVTKRTPPRAASGIRPTGAAATRTMSSSTRAWTMEARRVRPPARMLTEVRAMAPVAGMPPKSEDPIDAMPWPTSS